MKFRKHPILGLSLATLIAVAGCGGGGGGGSKSNPDPDPNPKPDEETITLSGFATKGAMKNAKVTAYELNEAGEQLANPVGTAETNATGAYELELNDSYAGGMIEVEVSVIPGTTKMICDASPCGAVAAGADVDLPEDFKLSTLVEKPSASDTVSASVTAWSSMAAKRARTLAASGKPLKDAAKQANAEVSQVVGFDIVKTEAKDLSQIAGTTGAQAQYAVMNAAAAEVLFAGSDGKDLTARLATFASALDDGAVGNSGDSVQLGVLSAAVRNIVASVPGIDMAASEALDNQAAQYAVAGNGGFTPGYNDDLVIGGEATQAEKIEAFQTFVAQTRTWVASAGNLNTDTMNSQVGVDVETVEAILSANSASRFQFLGLALDEVNSFMLDHAAQLNTMLKDGDEQQITIEDEMGTAVGTATVTLSGEDGVTITVAGAVTGEANTTFVPFELEFDTNLPADAFEFEALEDEGGAWLEVAVAKLLASTTISVSGYVEDGQGGKGLALNELSVSAELAQDLSGDELTTDNINAHFKSAAMAGSVTLANDGASFTGEVSLELVKLTSGFGLKGIETSPISVKSLGLSGEFIRKGGVQAFSAAVSLNVNNAGTFDTFAWADYSGNEREFYAPLNFEIFEQLIGVDTAGMEQYHLGINGDYHQGTQGLEYFAGYPVGDQWHNEDPRPVSDAEYQAIGKVLRETIAEDLDGNTELADQMEINWINVGGTSSNSPWVWFHATFPDLETAENFLKASFTLSASVNLPELNTAQVTATVNRSSYRGGSIRANVKWNGGNYTVLVNASDLDAPEVVNVRFFNAQGYELNMDAKFDAESGDFADLTGKALLNGDQVGTVEYRDGAPVIVYPNGDEEKFESLM